MQEASAQIEKNFHQGKIKNWIFFHTLPTHSECTHALPNVNL
jgi:hypothetical protein